MRHIVALSCLAIALLPPPVDAHACDGPTTSEPDAKWGDTYVAHSLVSVVVYEESNTIDGLQRRDVFVDDTCHGMIPADRRIA